MPILTAIERGGSYERGQGWAPLVCGIATLGIDLVHGDGGAGLV